MLTLLSVKEKLPQMSPSSFVLLRGNEEKRLIIGEELILDAGRVPDHDEILSFVVIPKQDHVKMNITYSDAFFTSLWGHIETKIGLKEKEFSHTFSSTALAHFHDNIWIVGTEMTFNPDLTALRGKNWSIVYRPLPSP